MIANNLVDLWAQLFSWKVYGDVWGLLNGTGVAYIPFLVAIFGSLKATYDNRSDSDSMLRSMEMSLFSMILVLLFVVIPVQSTPTDLASIEYVITDTSCESADLAGTGNDVNNDKAQAQLDNMLGGAGFEARMPLLWGITTQYSSALTHAAIRSMGCSYSYNDYLYETAKAQIHDAELIQRIGEFESGCYSVAREQLTTMAIDRSLLNKLWDVDWLGSKTFLQTPDSFYQSPEAYLHNQEAYGFIRDETNHQPDKQEPIERGANPYCSEVWNGAPGANGLRADLLTYLQDEYDSEWEHFSDEYFKMVDASLTTTSDKEDLFLRTVLQVQGINTGAVTRAGQSAYGVETQLSQDQGFSVSNIMNNVIGMAENVVAAVGASTQAIEAAQLMTANKAVKVVIPMIIALIQAVIVIATPIVLVFTSYRFTAFFTMAGMWFTLEFMHAILGLGNLFQHRLALLTSTDASEASALETVISVMLSYGIILILPIIWLMIMTGVGLALAKGFQSVGGSPRSGMSGNPVSPSSGSLGSSSTRVPGSMGGTSGEGGRNG